MTRQFDINKIMARYKLDAKETARVLFPYTKFPLKGFERILSGESDLDVLQLEKLALFIGVPVGDLFLRDGWKTARDDSYQLELVKGPWRARFGFDETTITLFKEGLLVEQWLVSPVVPISEVTKIINNYIKEREKDGNN